MIRPVRHRLSRARGWRLADASAALNGLPARAVTRPGRFGNPFTTAALVAAGIAKAEAPAVAARLHRAWLRGRLADDDLALALRLVDELPEVPDASVLKGVNLACWCALDAPCHADELLEAANGPAPIEHPCIVDIDERDYHGDALTPEPALSASLAQLLVEATARHAWWASPRLNPGFERTHAPHFDLGTAFHASMTSRGAAIVVIDASDWRTAAAREARDAAYARGQTPLLVDQVSHVDAMVDAARRQLQERGFGDPCVTGDCERSLFWQAGGVWNRCRPDVLHYDRRLIWDLKATGQLADPDAWVRTGMDRGLDLRVAHYLESIARLIGPGWRYVFAVVETAAPHLMSVLELPASAVELGADKLRIARGLWRACLDSGDWPGWPTEIIRPEIAPWHEAHWLEARARRPAPGAVRLAHEAQAPWRMR